MKKKYVIYTVMAGKYGNVRQPLCIDERFNYVLFSNEFNESLIGVWQVRSIPIPPEIEASDNKRLSRYPKTHPETMLAEYNASLYVDANIQIVDQWVYDRVVELEEQGVDYAGVQLVLTGCDDIYRHSFDMCKAGVENDYNAIVQMHALRKEGFPEHFGLNENNIIYRSHNERIQQADELWWSWIVRYSFRDQFSYMYCLWKYGIPINYFLPIGEDARNSSHFSFIAHNSNLEVAQKKWVRQGIGEKLRNKYRGLSQCHYRYYMAQWLWISRMFQPQAWLAVCGFFSVIMNSPLLVYTFVVKNLKHK